MTGVLMPEWPSASADVEGHFDEMAIVRDIGDCSAPIYLSEYLLTHGGNGTESWSERVVPVRCRNRRESICPGCARLHQGDTYQLVNAGLRGGKGVTPSVAEHPRLFVTLTPPSFGPVHRVGKWCRPRRKKEVCEHGNPLSCPSAHSETDPDVGQPLCPYCYDYTGHILWQAHLGKLWDQTVRLIRRNLASAAGIPRADLRGHCRLSYAKVAEYQRRGAVHLHAIVRVDGPEGPEDSPPAWASFSMLEDAIFAAIEKARASLPYVDGLGEWEFTWGSQIDVRPVKSFSESAITPERLAAYISKYVAKGVSDSGGTDRPIKSVHQIKRRGVNAHFSALMRTSWDLAEIPELAHLKLRKWTHTLAFRGHCLSKSRSYSITYAALRDERTAHRQRQRTGAPSERVIDRRWVYVGRYRPRYVGPQLIAGRSAKGDDYGRRLRGTK